MRTSVVFVLAAGAYAGVDVNALLLPSGPRWPPTSGLSSGTRPFYSSQGLDASVTTHAQVGVRF